MTDLSSREMAFLKHKYIHECGNAFVLSGRKCASISKAIKLGLMTNVKTKFFDKKETLVAFTEKGKRHFCKIIAREHKLDVTDAELLVNTGSLWLAEKRVQPNAFTNASPVQQSFAI